MRAILPFKRRRQPQDPMTQRIKLIVGLLFLLPVLVLAYFAALQVIRVDPAYEPRNDRDSQKGKHNVARSANELYIELDAKLLEIDQAARTYFGPAHTWPDADNIFVPPAIEKWMNATGDSSILKTYTQLSSTRNSLEQELNTLGQEIDRAAARGSEGEQLASELKARRATEQKIRRATANAEALANMLDTFAQSYLLYKETNR